MYIILLFAIIACKSSSKETESNIEKRAYIKERNPVEVIILEKTVFKKELVSSGKLVARKKSMLKFRQGGEIEELFVKNGSFIKAGQPIARLKRFDQEQRLKRAKLQLTKASLDLKDVIIGQGFDPNDTTKIPLELYEIAKSRSGYATAQNELETALFELESMTLVAPFNGIVANIISKAYEKVSGDGFCLLIDDSAFEVEFSVLETEISEIGINKELRIIPFSSEVEYKGKITEINPVVGENGLIAIKAIIINNGSLLEGMNVKVLVENKIESQLIVPKSAVLQRDNQEVLFRYTNGTAWWTYVETQLENSTSYAIIAHPEKGGSLEAGDTIIVSGNLNLAHESEVEIK